MRQPGPDGAGDTGTLRFEVKYPDSTVVYSSDAHIERWLAAEEEPDLVGGLGITLYTPPVPPVVGEVVADSPAAAAFHNDRGVIR